MQIRKSGPLFDNKFLLCFLAFVSWCLARLLGIPRTEMRWSKLSLFWWGVKTLVNNYILRVRTLLNAGIIRRLKGIESLSLQKSSKVNKSNLKLITTLWIKLALSAISSHFLNTFRSCHSTSSLSSPFQSLSALSVKKLLSLYTGFLERK